MVEDANLIENKFEFNLKYYETAKHLKFKTKETPLENFKFDIKNSKWIKSLRAMPYFVIFERTFNIEMTGPSDPLILSETSEASVKNKLTQCNWQILYVDNFLFCFLDNEYFCFSTETGNTNVFVRKYNICDIFKGHPIEYQRDEKLQLILNVGKAKSDKIIFLTEKHSFEFDLNSISLTRENLSLSILPNRNITKRDNCLFNSCEKETAIELGDRPLCIWVYVVALSLSLLLIIVAFLYYTNFFDRFNEKTQSDKMKDGMAKGVNNKLNNSKDQSFNSSTATKSKAHANSLLSEITVTKSSAVSHSKSKIDERMKKIAAKKKEAKKKRTKAAKEDSKTSVVSSTASGPILNTDRSRLNQSNLQGSYLHQSSTTQGNKDADYENEKNKKKIYE